MINFVFQHSYYDAVTDPLSQPKVSNSIYDNFVLMFGFTQANILTFTQFYYSPPMIKELISLDISILPKSISNIQFVLLFDNYLLFGSDTFYLACISSQKIFPTKLSDVNKCVSISPSEKLLIYETKSTLSYAQISNDSISKGINISKKVIWWQYNTSFRLLAYITTNHFFHHIGIPLKRSPVLFFFLRDATKSSIFRSGSSARSAQ